MIIKRITLSYNTGITNETITSNTLGRALINCAVELYGHEIVEDIISSPFSTSDLLPVLNNKKTKKKEYILPKPLLPLNLDFDDSRISYKGYKKSKYITEQAFNDILRFAEEEYELPRLKTEKGIIQLEDDKLEIEFLNESRPRNALLRANSLSLTSERERETGEFFFTEIFTSKTSQYYFVLSAETKETIEKIIGALNLLQHRGLGGNLSSGFGAFEILEIKEQESDKEEKSKLKMLLSHWIPSIEEVKNKVELKYYQLVSYSPIAKTIRNNPIPLRKTKFITSGSIISNVDNKIIGTHKQVGTEEEPSLAWGYAIFKGVD
ncbi:MAG: type III-A CRISPR-associated RAMP protein Csm4 [Candidatus Heimdallarchaeaceae archaeon]